jgi:hypothetical protein
MSKPARTSAPAKTSSTLAAEYDPDNPLGLPDRLDPADYDWYPVARRKRGDGWTHTRQRKFIEVLADTGSVREAAKQAGMSQQSCYRLRRAPGAEAFARAWDAAIEEASRRLVDVAFERAVQGVADPVFDREGACIAVRRRYNDRLLMFLLRAHHPERYRYARGDVRHSEEPALPPAAPVASAIELLGPPVPDDPGALMPPDELESRLIVAELSDGEVPHYHQDGPGDCDLTPELVSPDLDRKLQRILKRDREGRDQEKSIDRFEPGSHLL